MNSGDIGEDIQRLLTFHGNIHPIYTHELIRNTAVYICFPADKIYSVLKLRQPYVQAKILPDMISLQEMLCIWSPLEIISPHTFPFQRTIDPINTIKRPFKFISHKYSRQDPGKIGQETIELLVQFGQELIWLDNCCMCQDTGNAFFPGYNYDEHVYHIVNNCDIIINQAESEYILLNSNHLEYDSDDPLGIVLEFDKSIYLMKKLHSGAFDFYGVYGLEDNYYQINFHEEINELQMKLQVFRNAYFGRLWCYLERLSVNNDKTIHIYPGNINLKVELKELIRRMKYLMKLIIFHEKERQWIYKFLFGHSPVGLHTTKDLERMLPPLLDKLLWILGVHDSKDIKTMSPFAQVLTLSCFCDSDRGQIAIMESQHRKDNSFNLGIWLAGLRICLNSCKIGRSRITDLSNYSYLPFRQVVQWAIDYPIPRQVIAHADYKNTDMSRPEYSPIVSLSILTRNIRHEYHLDEGAKVWKVTISTEEQSESICRAIGCLCHQYRNQDIAALKWQTSWNTTFDYLCSFENEN